MTRPMPSPLPLPSLKPAFNSPVLQESLNKSFIKFKNFQESLNKLSADIVTLEKFLKDCGVNIEYLEYTPEVDSGKFIALAWERTGNSDFRLVTRRYTDNFNSFDSIEIEKKELSRPLIEQSSEVRRKLWKYLPKFVESLANNISSEEMPFPKSFNDSSHIPF